MAEEIQFNKNVFDKNVYSKVIDTSFTQLGVKPISDQIQSQPTTSDFFDMYNDLFYIIPEKGEYNSHEFLIKKSSDYIGFEANQEEIIALQNEIAQLRIELLDTQKQNIDLQISSSNKI